MATREGGQAGVGHGGTIQMLSANGSVFGIPVVWMMFFH